MTPQEYGFGDVNNLFSKQLEPLLPKQNIDGSFRKVAITEKDIKHVSLALRKFVNVSVEPCNVGMFLENVVKYFWVIIQYSKQFENSGSYNHYFVVRMALDVFLFVIDSLKIHSEMASKFVKVIDKIVEDFRQDQCIKEFFRMYSVFLTKIPKNLGSKHKSLHIFYELAQNTNDIETQAVIVEVVLKLFGFNLQRVMERNIFPEISELSNIAWNSSYEIIRMILDVLNRDSERIFSINCKEITLDKKPVIEFDVCNAGANSSYGVWLYINIPQRKLSFFCAKHLITSFTNTMFNTFTSWGVLSFKAEDALKTKFLYDKLANMLEMWIKIKTSSFNLFGDFKFDIVRDVGIMIPQRSNNFKQLINDVLPAIFRNFQDTMVFKDTKQEQTFDNEATPDNLSVKSTSSSPVISMSSNIRKKKLSTINEGQEVSHENVIILVSDDEAETTETNNNTIKEVDENQDIENKSIAENLPLETPRNTQKIRKISMPNRNEEPLFEKSITPISFTESMVGKPKKTKRKMSIPIEKQKTNQKKRKMSVPIEKAKINKENRSSKKISVPIENPEISKNRGLKISTPMTVSVHQPVEPLNETTRMEELPESTNIVLSEENINYSTSKVEDWLKTVSSENTVEEQENIPSKDVTPPGTTPSVLEDLEDVANWLERHKETKPSEKQQSGFTLCSQRSKSSGKTESLMHLLEKETSQPEASKVNKETEETNNEVRDVVDSVKINLESPRSSSDLPLSKLALKEKTMRKSADGASKPPPDVSSQPSLDVVSRTPPDVTQPPLDVTPPPLLDAISQPPPKEKLELSVAVDKAEEKDKRDHSSRSTTYESVSMDIIRDVDENEDIISHFPQPVIPEVTVLEFGSFSSDSNSIEYLIDRKNLIKSQKNKKINYVRNEIMVDNVTNNVENKDINSTTKETKEQNFVTSEKNNIENFEDHTSGTNSAEKNIINSVKDSRNKITEKSITNTVENKDIVKQKNSGTDANTKDKNFATYSSDTSSTGKSIIKSVKKKNLNSRRNELKETNFATNKDEVQEKVQVANESQDKSQNTSIRKRKRPLYNPGDYSYLSETIVEEYLPSETANKSISLVTRRPRGRPKKSSTKENQKPSKHPRKSNRSKRQTKPLCCTAKNSAEISTSLTLDKAFASLKKKIKEEKRMGKVQKKVERASKGRKNGIRVEVSSPSSPSSLEPFGKLVNKRNNKVNERVEKLNNSKRQKTETISKTVNIISNILVKPATDTFAGSPVPSDTENYKNLKPCFCRTYVKLLQQNFQELMTHVQRCDLDVFNKKKLSAVQDLLQKL